MTRDQAQALIWLLEETEKTWRPTYFARHLEQLRAEANRIVKEKT